LFLDNQYLIALAEHFYAWYGQKFAYKSYKPRTNHLQDWLEKVQFKNLKILLYVFGLGWNFCGLGRSFSKIGIALGLFLSK
jgi:hypothetical protein